MMINATKQEYPQLKLLGGGMSWTADLSKVGCRCIATMYLVPMASNSNKGSMGNFYCDANVSQTLFLLCLTATTTAPTTTTINTPHPLDCCDTISIVSPQLYNYILHVNIHDEKAIGGVNCAELDMEESNRHAFHSVLHTSHDTDGKNGGYGGGEWSWDGPRDWDKEKYGPGASCIDTLKPFNVKVSFPKVVSESE